MKQGSVVKVSFIQANKEIKDRPAVLLKKTEPYGDWIICAITSKLHLQIQKTDIVIDEKHSDFKLWGLDYPGLIRVAYLVTIPENIIKGVVGSLSKETITELLNNLSAYING